MRAAALLAVVGQSVDDLPRLQFGITWTALEITSAGRYWPLDLLGITLQIIYLLPFILLALASGLICLVVPRWRRYAAGALVGPIAFAGCSAIGLVMTILLAEHFGVDRAMGFSDSWKNVRLGGIVLAAICFVIPGAAGAIAATLIANRIWRWALRRLNPQS